MKRKFVVFNFILLLGGVICGLAYFLIPYYSTAEELPGSKLSSAKDDTLRVFFMGDSWGELQGGIYKDSLMVAIQRKFPDRKVKATANGVGGAKSKDVYYNMFEDDLNKNVGGKCYKSFHSALIEKPDYCIVSVGINDANTKLGEAYYVGNTKLILHQLLQADIYPILLEIPTVNLEKAYEATSPSHKALRQLSMWVTNSSLDCLADYRKSMDAYLQKSGMINHICYIRVNEWSPYGYNDKRRLFQDDEIHLNARGYHVLDSCIAERIDILEFLKEK